MIEDQIRRIACPPHRGGLRSTDFLARPRFARTLWPLENHTCGSIWSSIIFLLEIE